MVEHGDVLGNAGQEFVQSRKTSEYAREREAGAMEKLDSKVQTVHDLQNEISGIDIAQPPPGRFERSSVNAKR